MQSRPDGNRQDNRQRGNAAQLLEKYKAMARDSQLAGDRVQTEYFLQFADHYFRVLEDGRSRFEDQQTRRRGNDDEDEDGDEVINADADGDYDDEGEEEQRPAPRRDRPDQRPHRAERSDQDQRPPRPERSDQDQRPPRPERTDQDQRPQRAERDNSDQRPSRPERARRERANGAAGEIAEERIALGVLPPAIGVGGDTVEAEAPRPRRRVRKPREEDGDEIAPAA